MRRTLTLLLMVACKGPTEVVELPSSPAESDADTDADADADADADSDADADGLDCTPGAYPTPAFTGECLTGSIACGETVYASNVGGSMVFGTSSGEAFEQCSGSAFGQDYAGPERVFTLDALPDTRAIEVRLQSCEPSEMLLHREGQVCWDTMLPSCSYLAPSPASDVDQTDSFLLGNSGQMTFIVEGRGNDGGNFALTVDCFE